MGRSAAAEQNKIKESDQQSQFQIVSSISHNQLQFSRSLDSWTMTVKQIEKISTKVFTIHQENLEYWSRLDKDVTKTVDSFLNHREQIEMLSNLTLQFETKLLEFSDTFSKQNEALQKLSSRCLEESSSVEQSTVIETKPGESSLAEKIESCYKLSMLYNSIDTGLTTWMECR